MNIDLTAARKTAKRLRRIQCGETVLAVYGCEYKPGEYWDPYNCDVRTAIGFALAILEDPTVLMAEPVWVKGRWNSPVADYDVWPGRKGWFQRLADNDLGDCSYPTEAEAKAACVEDARERLKGMFQTQGVTE